MGYNLWDHRESDVTERLTLSLSHLTTYCVLGAGQVHHMCLLIASQQKPD